MHIPGEWSADGSRLLFAANRRHPDLFDLYVQPLDGRSLDGRSLAYSLNQDGTSALALLDLSTGATRCPHREADYGSLAKDRDFLERIAPINHIEKLTAPLMVIHGANDPRVPLSEAEQLVAALQNRDVPVKFLVYHDEGHGIVKLKNKLSLYPQVVTFLQEVLAT